MRRYLSLRNTFRAVTIPSLYDEPPRLSLQCAHGRALARQTSTATTLEFAVETLSLQRLAGEGVALQDTGSEDCQLYTERRLYTSMKSLENPAAYFVTTRIPRPQIILKPAWSHGPASNTLPYRYSAPGQ
ncbi:hypothetical protein NDU88_002678 [Pleurodeles waltl]|uniref:Uncharacterized protein n=1 Tax=Pleurodeles waltl TaxID=8319 RepID=A0AAV7PAD5_PLEWA|nr:hypothetical protein NDU88_002678 [Pleurodeles waltl]